MTATLNGIEDTTLILGTNDANNAYSSSSVVYDRDGSVLERLEYATRTGWIQIEKSDGACLNGSDLLFTVTGGPIMMYRLIGVVTTDIGANAATCHIDYTTTTPAATTTALSTTVNIETDAAGTTYNFTNVAVPVLTPTTNGVVQTTQALWLLPIGGMFAHCSAANTGNIKWYLAYVPLSPNSEVIAAA